MGRRLSLSVALLAAWGISAAAQNGGFGETEAGIRERAEPESAWSPRLFGPDSVPRQAAPGELDLSLSVKAELAKGGDVEVGLDSRSRLIEPNKGGLYHWRSTDFGEESVTTRRLGAETSPVSVGPMQSGNLVSLARSPFGSLTRNSAVLARPALRLDRARSPVSRRGVVLHPFDGRLTAGVYWDDPPEPLPLRAGSDYLTALVAPPAAPKTAPRLVQQLELPIGSHVELAQLASATKTEREERDGRKGRWIPKETSLGRLLPPTGALLSVVGIKLQLTGRGSFVLLGAVGSGSPRLLPGSVVSLAAGVASSVDRGALTEYELHGRSTVRFGPFTTLDGERQREYARSRMRVAIQLRDTLEIGGDYDLRIHPPTLSPAERAVAYGAAPANAGRELRASEEADRPGATAAASAAANATANAAANAAAGAGHSAVPTAGSALAPFLTPFSWEDELAVRLGLEIAGPSRSEAAGGSATGGERPAARTGAPEFDIWTAFAIERRYDALRRRGDRTFSGELGGEMELEAVGWSLKAEAVYSDGGPGAGGHWQELSARSRMTLAPGAMTFGLVPNLLYEFDDNALSWGAELSGLYEPSRPGDRSFAAELKAEIATHEPGSLSIEQLSFTLSVAIGGKL